jgi:dihydrofolate reductase
VVGVAAGTVAGQCLAAGLLDEVAIDLVPVVLGAGRRYFSDFTDSGSPRLGDPTTNIQGDRLTHLIFPVDRG